MNIIKFLILLLANVRSFHVPCITDFHNIKEVTSHIPYETRVKIVEEATGILPKLDWFGHMVLNNNEKVIDFIINTDLSESNKKILILKTIELCRNGDDMGGKILENYYNLINLLL